MNKRFAIVQLLKTNTQSESKMKDLEQYELEILYWNFIAYRDNVCNGYAKMSVENFYKKFGLNPWKE